MQQDFRRWYNAINDWNWINKDNKENHKQICQRYSWNQDSGLKMCSEQKDSFENEKVKSSIRHR